MTYYTTIKSQGKPSCVFYCSKKKKITFCPMSLPYATRKPVPVPFKSRKKFPFSKFKIARHRQLANTNISRAQSVTCLMESQG
jgi:hypothetical protein